LRFDWCMSKVDWFNFTLINFSVNIWDTLIWAHRWPYEPIDHLIWPYPCALRAYRRLEECVCYNTFYNIALKIAPETPFKEQICYISGSNYGTWIIKLRFMQTVP
jgi:hypothetical protein